MSGREPEKAKAFPLPATAGAGYGLSFHDGMATNRCAVAMRDGKLLYARLSSQKGEASFMDRLEEELDTADQRADVPWAFAMAGGAPVESLMDALGMPHEGREAAVESLSAIVSANVPSLEGLDGRALSALSAAPAKRPGAVSFYSGDGERGERRRQAAASYPLLADVISANLSAKMAVDRSQPLADVLSGILGGMASGNVGKAVVKRIASSPALPEGCDLDTVVRFMTLVPADWIPHGEGEWNAFCHVAHALLEDLGATDKDVPALIKGCGGKWTEFCARIVKKAGMDEADVTWGVRRAMFSASEMLNCFSEVAVLPMAAHGGPSNSVPVTPEMMMAAARSAFSILASGRTAGELADLQRRWHQERAGILDGTRLAQEGRAAAMRGSIEEGGWPGLSDPVQAPNGLWLIPLTTPSALEAEGHEGNDADGVQGLRHCVGSYSSKAKKCDCHIVSVRRIDGEGRHTRITTVEFDALKPESNLLNVRQNMARGNGKAPPESVDAVKWYVSSAASGAIGLNRELIAAFLNKEIIPDDGVERICGYDWKDRDVLNASVGPWGPFVAQAFRKPLDEILEAEEVAGITRMISPDILLAGR